HLGGRPAARARQAARRQSADCGGQRRDGILSLLSYPSPERGGRRASSEARCATGWGHFFWQHLTRPPAAATLPLWGRDKQGDPMQGVTVVDHPLVQHKLSLMRDKQRSTKGFRELMHEIGMLLCYEVTRDLPLDLTDIETPLVP